jgi:hypothetical protein
MHFIKYNILLIFCGIGFTCKAQHCSCDSSVHLKEVISCDTFKFKNDSKLYRQFNCDSSWLTFESREGIKTILYSLEKPLVELTERLGYQFTQEYNYSFLIMNFVISGCCTPPDFHLFNKETGRLIVNLGPTVYISEKYKHPFILYFSDSSYDAITLMFADSGKKYHLKLPEGRVSAALANGALYAEHLFNTPNFSNDIFTIKYRYIKPGNKNWYAAVLKIDLKQYQP